MDLRFSAGGERGNAMAVRIVQTSLRPRSPYAGLVISTPSNCSNLTTSGDVRQIRTLLLSTSASARDLNRTRSDHHLDCYPYRAEAQPCVLLLTRKRSQKWKGRYPSPVAAEWRITCATGPTLQLIVLYCLMQHYDLVQIFTFLSRDHAQARST